MFSHIPAETGAMMSDQLGEAMPQFGRPWDSLRRYREPAAWVLLAIAAAIVLVSAGQLFHLGGATIPVAQPTAVSNSAPVSSGPVGSSSAPPSSTPGPGPTGPAPAPAPQFALRASSVAPQFIDAPVQVLPVLALILVTFCGGLTERAYRVGWAAAGLQAAAFALALISLVGASHVNVRPGTWYVLEAIGLAITAAGLIFTVAVLRSGPYRSLTLQFDEFVDEDDDGFDSDYGGHD
jgi:hypothetical protein